MPDLIQEMTEDLFYYEDEHENLKSKIRIPENTGFVFDITPGNATKYQFDEELVEMILNMK